MICRTIASSEQEAASTLGLTLEFDSRCLLSLTQAFGGLNSIQPRAQVPLRSRFPIIWAATSLIFFALLTGWAVWTGDRVDMLYAIAYTLQFSVVLPGLLLLDWRLQRWVVGATVAFIVFAFTGLKVFGDEFDRGQTSALWDIFFTILPAAWWIGYAATFILGAFGWRRYFRRTRHGEAEPLRAANGG